MSFTLREILGVRAEALAPTPAPAPLPLCPSGKVAYATKEAADSVLGYLNRRQRPMRRYRCALCAHYHLGHRRGTV